MRFKSLATSAVAVKALMLSVSASATTINFDQSDASSASGTISYAGNGGALTGSGIGFDEISLNSSSDRSDPLADLCVGHDQFLHRQ